MPEAKSPGKLLGRGRKETCRNHSARITSLAGRAAGTGSPTPSCRAAHPLIFRGKDLTYDVLLYQGGASCYPASKAVIFVSSKATSSETSTRPGQQVTYYCLVFIHMPIAQRLEQRPLRRASSLVKRHSKMQVRMEVAQKCYYLVKKKRLNQSPNLKIVKKPVCVERLFILKNIFSNF